MVSILMNAKFKWENFNVTSVLEIKGVFSNWYMEYIADADNIYVKRVYKDFQIKSKGFSHESNILFLADLFKTF